MLTRREFMEAVLPPEGVYCVFAMDGKRVHSQTFFGTQLEVDAVIDHLEEQKLNSFIALGNYASDRNRTAENVISLKSFFLDLDCGGDDARHYPDQAEALRDLKRFVKEMALPRPLVVNSGRGIHAYWPLTEAVPRVQWEVAAKQLKTVCLLRGMKIDPAVPADSARVLRAVGTSNYKDPLNPLRVEVLTTAAPVEFTQFKQLLGVPDVAVVENLARAPLDDVTKSLLANRPSSFRTILERSAAGEGCAQILQAATDQENVSEPMWRAALSIAQHCKDRAKAIHVISNKHPEYSHADTEEKAARIQGPYKCETFWSTNPAGCEGCKHRGSITSPIQLGRGLAEAAKPEDNTVRDAVSPSKLYVIPEYPFPYFRGKNSGVYLRTKNKEGEPEDHLVYENDFYLVNTIDDPILGMSALFRVHLPKDGVREFMIPMQDMVAKETFGKRLAREGVSAIGKQMELLIVYASKSIKSYQNKDKARKSRLQFGWADNFTAFIIGDRCVTATDITYSPPSSVTLGLVPLFRQEGTLEAWKKVMSNYNRPGMELHMFALFGGFGSPLVPFSRKKGSVMSMYSQESGTGKTTMLKAVNSIFGHPEQLMLIKDDTPKSRINRIGTLQNITPTIDEITNETPENVSAFIYHYLHGRGGNRLQGSNNVERLNATTWEANCMVTSNAPLEDKLHSKKHSPDGEMSRFLEFEWYQGNDMTKTESDEVFGPLDYNYGWAGDTYIQFIIQNLDLVKETMKRVSVAVDARAELRNRERFWSAQVTTHLVGGLMARQAGVLDFTDDDFQRVFDWIVIQLIEKKQKAKEYLGDVSGLLGAFINDYINDVLIINSDVVKRGTMQEAPIREPRNKLCWRYEPDTRNIYIRRSLFRKYCNDHQAAFAQVLRKLRSRGKLIAEKKARIGKGMFVSQPEDVLVFNDPEVRIEFDEPAKPAHARDSVSD